MRDVLFYCYFYCILQFVLFQANIWQQYEQRFSEMIELFFILTRLLELLVTDFLPFVSVRLTSRMKISFASSLRQIMKMADLSF